MLSLEPFVHIEFHLLKTQATIASFPPHPQWRFAHTWKHTGIYTHMHTHMYAHIHVYTHIRAYTCTHKHSYTHINTHINGEIKSDSVTSLSHSIVYSQWALPASALHETDSPVDTRAAVSSSAPRGGPDQMAVCRLV